MARRKVQEGEPSVRLQTVVSAGVRDQVADAAESVAAYEGSTSALIRQLLMAFVDGAVQVRKSSYPSLHEAAKWVADNA